MSRALRPERASSRIGSVRLRGPDRPGSAAAEELLALLLQLFGGLGFDAATETARRKRGTRGEVNDEDGRGRRLPFAGVGGACGGISLPLAPNPPLPNLGLRVAN